MACSVTYYFLFSNSYFLLWNLSNCMMLMYKENQFWIELDLEYISTLVLSIIIYYYHHQHVSLLSLPCWRFAKHVCQLKLFLFLWMIFFIVEWWDCLILSQWMRSILFSNVAVYWVNGWGLCSSVMWQSNIESLDEVCVIQWCANIILNP